MTSPASHRSLGSTQFKLMSAQFNAADISELLPVRYVRRTDKEKQRKEAVRVKLEREEKERLCTAKQRNKSSWVRTAVLDEKSKQEKINDVRTERERNIAKDYDEVIVHNKLYIWANKKFSDNANQFIVNEIETKNVLFEGEDQNFLKNWRSHPSIIDTLASQIHKRFLTSKCNTIPGHKILEFIIKKSENHFSKSDAKVFIEKYLFHYFVPVPYHFDSVFHFKEESEYRRNCDDRPEYYCDVINVIPKSLKKYDNTAIIREVERIMTEVCSDRYINYPAGTFDYYSLSKSKTFSDMVQCSGRLRQLNLFGIPENARVPLFVNIYNMMIIQGQVMCPCGDNEQARNEFLRRDLYLIGPYKCSAFDLRMLLLNETHALPKYKHYLWKFAITKVDPRVLFVMSNGCLGDPLPSAVHVGNFEKEITVASANFINRDIEIDIEKKCMVVHDLFCRYRPLFADTIRDLIRILDLCVTDLRKRSLLEPLSVVDIIFRDFDYRSNRKPPNQGPNDKIRLKQSHRDTLILSGINPVIFQDDAYLSFDQVMNNDCYRDFLRMFAMHECSFENVIFWERCQIFKRVTSLEERFSMAIEIYETFIEKNSELQLNIAQWAIDKIKEKLFIKDGENVNTLKNRVFIPLKSDLFDEVETIILSCICDIFYRFVVSELYKGMVEDVRQFAKTMEKRKSTIFCQLTKLVEEKGIEAVSWRQDGTYTAKGNNQSFMTIEQRIASLQLGKPIEKKYIFQEYH